MAVSPADFELYSRVTGRPLPRSPQERMKLAPEVNRFIRNREYERPEKTALQKGADVLGKVALIGGTLAAAHAIGGGFGGRAAGNVGKAAEAAGLADLGGDFGVSGDRPSPYPNYPSGGGLSGDVDFDGAALLNPADKADNFLAKLLPAPVRPDVEGEQLPTNAFGVPNEAWDSITKKVQGKKVVVRPSLLSEAEKQMQSEKIYGEKLTKAERVPLHRQYDTIQRDQSSLDYPTGTPKTEEERQKLQKEVDNFLASRYEQATEESLGGIPLKYDEEGRVVRGEKGRGQLQASSPLHPLPLNEPKSTSGEELLQIFSPKEINEILNRDSGESPPETKWAVTANESERMDRDRKLQQQWVRDPINREIVKRHEANANALGNRIADKDITEGRKVQITGDVEPIQEANVFVESDDKALGGKTNAELRAARLGPTGKPTLRGRNEAWAIDTVNKAFDLRNIDRQVTGTIAGAATGAVGIGGRQLNALVHGGLQPNAGGNIAQRVVDNYWSNVKGMAGEDPILGAIGKGGGLVQQGVQNTSRFRFPDIPIMGEHMQNPFSIRFPSVGNIVGGIYSHIPGHSLTTHAAEAVGRAATVGGAELGLLATGIGADLAARGTLAAGAAFRRQVDPDGLNPWIPTRYEWSQGITPYNEALAKAYPTIKEGARIAGEALGSATRGLTNLDVAAQEGLRQSPRFSQRMYEHDEGMRSISQFMDSVRAGLNNQAPQNLGAPQLPPGASLDIAPGDVNLEGAPINYRTADHPSYGPAFKEAQAAQAKRESKLPPEVRATLKPEEALHITPGSLMGYESQYLGEAETGKIPLTADRRAIFHKEGLSDPNEAVFGRTPGEAQLQRFRDNYANQEVKAQLEDNRMAVAEEGFAGGKTQPFAVRVSDHVGVWDTFGLSEVPYTQTEAPNKTIHGGSRKKRYERVNEVVDRANRIQAARERRIAKEQGLDDPWS